MKHIIKICYTHLKRLTIFDWLVVFVAIGGLFFAAIFLFKQERWIRVEVKISPKEWWWDSKSPPQWLTRSLAVGQKEYDALGRAQAEIVDIHDYEYVGSRKLTYLTINLKAEYDKRTNKFKFNHKPLDIGSPIELSFNSLGTAGTLTFVEGIPDPRLWEDKVVEARVINLDNVFPETMGIKPWAADAIHIGDEMKDSRGRVVATILQKSVTLADKVVTTADGRIMTGKDATRNDVYLTMKLKTSKQGTLNYFLDEFKVKVGFQIPITLPSIDIWPEITKIVE